MKFLWEKDNITFEGQDDTELLESEIRLRIINESLGIIRNIIQCVSLTCDCPGMYTCHVTNKLGGSTCALLVSEAILHAEVLDPLLIFIISILLAMLVVVLLAVLCYLCCRKRKDYSVGKY